MIYTINVIIRSNVIYLCTGLIYTYLAEGSGNTSGRGAFRALQRGFNHWSSGRVSYMEINVLLFVMLGAT